MKPGKFLSILCVMAMLCSALTLCAKEYKIGTTKFTLPASQGWVDAIDVYPEWVETMKNLMQPNIQVAAGLLQQSDADFIKQGKEPLIQRYCIVGSMPQFEKLPITPQVFALIRREFKKQYKNMPELVEKQLKELEEQISQKLSNDAVSVKYKNNAIIPVGVEYEDENMLATSMIITSSFVVNGNEMLDVQACITVMMLIKNKVLLLYGYVPYQSRADLENCKTATLKVAKNILKANQQGKSAKPATKSNRPQ